MRRLSLMALVVGILALAVARAEDADKTYKVDDEGFIRNWLILEPISLGDGAGTHEEDSQKEFFNKEFFTGQKDAKPKAGDKVTVDGKPLTWHAVQSDDYAVDLEKVATDAGKEATNALFLGVAYIVADDDMNDLKLSIGSDDSSVWKLNGKEVIRVYEGRGIDKDQNDKDGLALKKGVNVLSMAVINGEGPTAGCARFLDKAGNPLKNLKITLMPAAEAK